jgi:hypothetical protein
MTSLFKQVFGSGPGGSITSAVEQAASLAAMALTELRLKIGIVRP